jgi:hypothetical protein
MESSKTLWLVSTRYSMHVKSKGLVNPSKHIKSFAQEATKNEDALAHASDSCNEFDDAHRKVNA